MSQLPVDPQHEETAEPQPDEAALLAGDLERDRRKAEKLHERNDAEALDAQVQHLRSQGGL